MSGSFLYLIGPADADTPTKIGISRDPRKRLAQLQTSSPQRLAIKHTIATPDRETARRWERNAHIYFACQCLHGEWFNITVGQILSSIKVWTGKEVCRKPRAQKAINIPSPALHEPNHPIVPARLEQKSTREMSVNERREFWACFDLPAPPDGFNDWYIIGSQKSGVIGAVPVSGFVHGEPD